MELYHLSDFQHFIGFCEFIFPFLWYFWLEPQEPHHDSVNIQSQSRHRRVVTEHSEAKQVQFCLFSD